MKSKLIPPDKKRCQSLKKEGCWPDAQHFMIIGPRRMVRCPNKPLWIVFERRVNKSDGLKGSMSLCEECLAVFKGYHRNDLKSYRFERLGGKTPQKRAKLAVARIDHFIVTKGAS